MTEMTWDANRGLWSEKPIARLHEKHFSVAEDVDESPREFYDDALGTSIEVGDIIAYPIKRGSSACALRIARVTRDDPTKGHLQAEIRVRDFSGDWQNNPDPYKHKKVALKNPDRIIVAMRRTYAECNKFELPVGP